MKSVPLLAPALVAAGPALSAPYTFQPLPLTARAINDNGVIGGEARVSPFGHSPDQPALYDGRAITFQDVGFSNGTTITGLNNAGDFVGLKLRCQVGGTGWAVAACVG